MITDQITAFTCGVISCENVDACVVVYLIQFFKTSLVSFCYNDCRSYLLILSDGNELIDQKQIRARFCNRGYEKKHIKICKRRPDKLIAAFTDLIYDTASVLFFRKLNIITAHGRYMHFSEYTPCFTFIYAVGGFYCVEASDSFYYQSCHINRSYRSSKRLFIRQ